MQQFPPARQPLFHRVLAQFQIRRDSLNGLVFAIKQNQRLAVNFRNALDGAPQNRFLLLADGEVVRRQSGRGRFVVQRLGGMARLAAQFFQRVANVVPRDAAQPRAQLVRFAQARQLFPRGDERLLCQVLALT